MTAAISLGTARLDYEGCAVALFDHQGFCPVCLRGEYRCRMLARWSKHADAASVALDIAVAFDAAGAYPTWRVPQEATWTGCRLCGDHLLDNANDAYVYDDGSWAHAECLIADAHPMGTETPGVSR